MDWGINRHGQPLTIHEGNHGEHYVAWCLSRHAIVRSPGQGEDTGVDLYCEGVNPASGTKALRLLNHFYIQVKTTAFQKTRQSQGRSPPIEIKHLRYWLEQPVPVYVFHVALPFNWLRSRSPKPKITAYDIAWWAAHNPEERDKAQRQSTTTIPRGFPWTIEFDPKARGKKKRSHVLHSFGSFVVNHVASSHAVVAGHRGIVRYVPDSKGKPTVTPSSINQELCRARLSLTLSLFPSLREELASTLSDTAMKRLRVADGAILNAAETVRTPTKKKRR